LELGRLIILPDPDSCKEQSTPTKTTFAQQKFQLSSQKELPQTFPSSKDKHNPSNPNPKLTRQPTKIPIKTQNPKNAENFNNIYSEKYLSFKSKSSIKYIQNFRYPSQIVPRFS